MEAIFSSRSRVRRSTLSARLMAVTTETVRTPETKSSDLKKVKLRVPSRLNGSDLLQQISGASFHIVGQADGRNHGNRSNTRNKKFRSKKSKTTRSVPLEWKRSSPADLGCVVPHCRPG